jgi:hypothetical protein
VTEQLSVVSCRLSVSKTETAASWKGKSVKRSLIALLLIGLTLVATAPAYASHGSVTVSQKQAEKAAKKYNKQWAKQQKKQLKAQEKAMKEQNKAARKYNREHPSRSTT